MAEQAVSKRGVRKARQGVVVSKSGIRTVVVQIEMRRHHPLYGKVVRQFSKFHAHDEENTADVGDVVRIVECRPMSRMKRWRVTGIVEKAARKE